MAVRARYYPGEVDMGDLKSVTEEVLDEAVELYDVAYSTVVSTFTKPMTGAELDQVVAGLDLEMLSAIVQGDPEAARELVRRMDDAAR